MKIQIDGQNIEAEVGEMLIAATGLHPPLLRPSANCRMCLVEVEKAKCRRATPVQDPFEVGAGGPGGHPRFLLDCPVCDQGGECPRTAMGYGSDDSRFVERKRALPSHDIGPLVATEMTRCIHCTRCVRFGEEVAGVMEMGMPGRGEGAWIGTFLNRTVDSEVSGNMIDLCPVGALTSKPYRFAARAWELENHRGISPHDCVGANLNIQTLRGQVERVLPVDNPAVNECWLADRDRYSYEAVNSAQRLSVPMLRERGQWVEVAWEAALQHACDGIKAVIASDGAAALGALAGYTSTLEEYYLLQKLVRALGGNNVDHRLQQSDFRDDEVAPLFPASELPIDGFDALQAALLVGSNIRKEQPLLALRLRAATRRGARISTINPLAYRQNFEVENMISAGADMAAHLAGVATDIAKAAGTALPGEIEQWAKQPTADRQPRPGIAESLLAAGAEGAVIIGALAQQHGDAGVLKGIAQWICQTTGGRLVILAPGNSAAAWQAGCVPHRGVAGAALSGAAGAAGAGYNAAAMFDHPRRAYLLLATDPELDGINGKAAGDALKNAELVVSITAYKSAAALGCADVLLPMSAFTESAGTFVNCEGRIQQAEVAASPRGESRPAWKILRVLGNFLDLPGFDYVTLAQVSADVRPDANPGANPGAKRCQRKSPRGQASGKFRPRPRRRPHRQLATAACGVCWTCRCIAAIKSCETRRHYKQPPTTRRLRRA